MGSINRKLVCILYDTGLNSTQIALHMKHHKSAIKKVLRKYSKYDPLRDSRRIWDTKLDPELKDLYINQGLGTMRCAHHLNFPEGVVRHALKRLGIMDSSRKCKRVHQSSAERTAKRKVYEFTEIVKQVVYLRDAYICKWCKKPTLYTDRTVHHVIPINEAVSLGLPAEQIRGSLNGETFHRSCHTDPKVFPFLHNGRHWHSNVSPKPLSKPPRLCSCGSIARLRTANLCYPCAAIHNKLSRAMFFYAVKRGYLTPNMVSPPLNRRNSLKFTSEQFFMDLSSYTSATSMSRAYNCTEGAIRNRCRRHGFKTYAEARRAVLNGFVVQ